MAAFTIPVLIGGGAILGIGLLNARKKRAEKEEKQRLLRQQHARRKASPNYPPKIDVFASDPIFQGQAPAVVPHASGVLLPQAVQQPALDFTALSEAIKVNQEVQAMRQYAAFKEEDFSGRKKVYRSSKWGWESIPVVNADRVISRVQKRDPLVLRRLFTPNQLHQKSLEGSDVVAIRITSWEEFRWFGKLLGGVLLSRAFAPQMFVKQGLMEWIHFFTYHRFEIADPLKTSIETALRSRLYRKKRPGEAFSRDHFWARGNNATPACPGYSDFSDAFERGCQWKEDPSLAEGGWYECRGNEWCYPQEFEFVPDDIKNPKGIESFVEAPLGLIMEVASAVFYQTAFIEMTAPQRAKGSMVGALINSLFGAFEIAAGAASIAAGGGASAGAKTAGSVIKAISNGFTLVTSMSKVKEDTALARGKIEELLQQALVMLRNFGPTRIIDFSGYQMGVVVPPWIDWKGWQSGPWNQEFLLPNHQQIRLAPQGGLPNEYITKTSRVMSNAQIPNEDIQNQLPVAPGGYKVQNWTGPYYEGQHYQSGRKWDDPPFGYINDPLATYFALGWNRWGTDKAAPQLPFFYLGIDFDIPLWLNHLDRNVIALRPKMKNGAAGNQPIGFEVVKIPPESAGRLLLKGDDLGIL